MSQVGLGLAIGGAFAALLVFGAGVYKLATDEEFRQGAIERVRRFGSALNPMNWVRARGGEVAPEAGMELQQITAGENPEAASDVGGPLHESQTIGQTFSNPVFAGEEQQRPATPPVQIRGSRQLQSNQQQGQEASF